MPDIHATAGDNGNRWTVVMHIAVPAGNNSVGVSWATALLNIGIGGTTGLPNGDGTQGTISTAEKDAIEAGTVFEHSGSFLVESGGTTNEELQASLRKFYTREKTRVLNDLQARLKYFGHTESGV